MTVVKLLLFNIGIWGGLSYVLHIHHIKVPSGYMFLLGTLSWIFMGMAVPSDVLMRDREDLQNMMDKLDKMIQDKKNK